MNETKWERIGALTGLIAVALIFSSMFFVPEYPERDASSAEILSFIQDNSEALVQSAYISIIAAPFLLWFAGTLLSYLRRQEATGRVSVIGFGGVIGATTLFAAQGAIQAGIADSAEDLTPEIARVASSIAESIGFVGFLLLLLWVFAVSLVILRTKALPVFLGWIGMVFAPIGFASSLGFVFPEVENLFDSPAGFALFLLFLIYMVLLPITLILRLGKQEAA